MNNRPPTRLTTVALTAIIAVLLAAPTAVWAAHQFTDVPDSHTFHNAIDWMKDNNITVGCNPPGNTQYCPDDNVTRGQMAAFMKRLAENQVVDAATLQGVEVGELAQTVYTTRLPGPLDIPGVADFQSVLQLNLRAGSWLVMAKAWYWNTGTTDGWADCRLVSPNVEDNTWVDVAMEADNNQVGAAFLLVDEFEVDSPINLECRDGGNTVEIRDAVITALKLNSVVEQ
ncbi:MAG TPA: S-layer homology domain-containing protein [Acidimicrobiia bacterium]|nr:S-layer homology domain-containing protein [Acidimicrobiia bacterium]